MRKSHPGTGLLGGECGLHALTFYAAAATLLDKNAPNPLFSCYDAGRWRGRKEGQGTSREGVAAAGANGASAFMAGSVLHKSAASPRPTQGGAAEKTAESLSFSKKNTRINTHFRRNLARWFRCRDSGCATFFAHSQKRLSCRRSGWICGLMRLKGFQWRPARGHRGTTGVCMTQTLKSETPPGDGNN
ncbi:hypothetical protein NDU88_011482 [Pleurodeles waltl]|uniref:Uncharacterized protein n=1 Tax=Pleurodeles waltl TaxID=8319 RepID=A0AAV7QXD3_PLEWA|nr:hypothetical protein NDU88_011482 [Pleurodeles waltl]